MSIQTNLRHAGLRAFVHSRSAVFSGEGLALPLIEWAVTRRRPRLPIDDPPLARAIRLSLRQHLEADIARIERGVYPLEVLRPESPVRHLRRLPRLVREGIKASLRRQSHQSKVFGDEAQELLSEVPEYYRRNFHFQADGYLSDASAELYDHQVEVLFAGAGDSMRRLIIEPMKRRLGSQDGAGLVFLDLGAGTGRATRFVRLAFPKARIVAIDLSGHYLRSAQKQLRHFARHDFIEADAANLPFSDQRFDAVYSVFLFHELPAAERSRVIREARRVLKPGGFFGLVDSIQLGDRSEFDDALKRFPADYHEPFYRNYIETPIAPLLQAQGCREVEESCEFFSKAVYGRF